MAVLSPSPLASLETAELFQCSVGGAESNVAMGLAALGVPTHWLSRLGDDAFGRRILRTLREHQVGVSGVQLDPERPTGLYLKAPADDGSGSEMLYYRRGSAASAMSPSLLDSPAASELLRSVGLIHFSGITAALSGSCLELCEELVSAPREGRIVSFDLNWRPSLWQGRNHRVLRELANRADIVLLGLDEAESAFGSRDEQELREILPAPQTLVLKNSEHSTVSLCRSGGRQEVPALAVELVEPVGAGDAFAAGYLSGLLLGLDERAKLRRGHLAAACTLTVPGDRGPLPPAAELEALLNCEEADWLATSVSATGIDSPALTGQAVR